MQTAFTRGPAALAHSYVWITHFERELWARGVTPIARNGMTDDEYEDALSDQLFPYWKAEACGSDEPINQYHE
jgi:hypothetical protein